jgi:hypothetical protein
MIKRPGRRSGDQASDLHLLVAGAGFDPRPLSYESSRQRYRQGSGSTQRVSIGSGIAVSPTSRILFIAPWRLPEAGVIVGLSRMMGHGGWCSPRRSSDGQMIFSMIVKAEDHASDLRVWGGAEGI